MKINYVENKQLPKLAWIAKCEAGGKAEVIHGSMVECEDNFFVEGAWNGDFLNGDFDNAEWFCGTGGVVFEDGIVFATPTGMHSGLYCVQEEKEFIISNSLCLLMASEGYEFDPAYDGYETAFNYNVLQGIYKYDSKVHLLKKYGNQKVYCDGVQMILFRNVVVHDDGTVKIFVKPETEGFDSFDEYYSRLFQVMKCLAENARDNARKYKYGVTSFISSGYDAATCSAVAKEIGANTVMTFEAKGKYIHDSGVEAAKRLGYENIVEKDAYSYLNRTDFPEIQSISGGDMGFEISFSTFREEMRGNLVFSGENGDFVWNKNKSFQTINDEAHIVWKNSEIGLGEAHLHQEYIPVPMTSFGIRHWTDLYKISNSEVMKPWSLGNDYDRPIPRRILESKGLPRESFGMKKYGAGFYYAYDWKKRLLNRMSKKSAVDFEQYVDRHKKMLPIKKYLIFLWTNKAVFANVLLSRLHIQYEIKSADWFIEKRNSVPNPFAARYLIPWAGERMVGEYKKALEANETEEIGRCAEKD